MLVIHHGSLERFQLGNVTADPSLNVAITLIGYYPRKARLREDPTIIDAGTG